MRRTRSKRAAIGIAVLAMSGAIAAACSSVDSSESDGSKLGKAGSGPGAASGSSSTTSGSGGTGGNAQTAATSSAGGAQTSSSASSGVGGSTGASGGAGGGLGDPCAGASDGAHCGADLGGLADHSSLYQCQSGKTASAMGCPAGCESGSCKQQAMDPCANANSGDGAYCGGSLGSGDPNTLYQCQSKATASSQVCAAGCQVNPPGVADLCKSAGDPCSGANSGNGLYCGASLGGGNPDALYDCENNVTASSSLCDAGCQVNPPGMADACKSNGGGTCCLNHPPGVVTQPFTACGNGGSHYGIDYGTPIGTPIYAGIAGTVVGSALGFPNCYDNGCTAACYDAFNYIKIETDCGDPNDMTRDFFVYYLHINDLAPGIANGSHVDQGELVAHSGNSGCSSGPHIHIEAVSEPKGTNAVLDTCNSVSASTRYCPGQ